MGQHSWTFFFQSQFLEGAKIIKTTFSRPEPSSERSLTDPGTESCLNFGYYDITTYYVLVPIWAIPKHSTYHVHVDLYLRPTAWLYIPGKSWEVREADEMTSPSNGGAIAAVSATAAAAC